MTLTCTSSNPRETLTWSRQQGQPLPYSAQSRDGILTLSQLTTQESGLYECSNSDHVTVQAQLKVNQVTAALPTAKITGPKKLDIAQGGQGFFQCIVEGTREAQWTKLGGELNRQTTSIRGTDLHFFNVEVEDRGVYICGVENDSGSSRDSAILEVERREQPRIEIYPSNNQSVAQGGSVLFQCRALSGIPSPTIEWRTLSGTSLGRNVEILDQQGVVRITDVQKSNEDRYECSATNLAGRATAIASLTVTISPRLTLQSPLSSPGLT